MGMGSADNRKLNTGPVKAKKTVTMKVKTMKSTNLAPVDHRSLSKTGRAVSKGDLLAAAKVEAEVPPQVAAVMLETQNAAGEAEVTPATSPTDRCHSCLELRALVLDYEDKLKVAMEEKEAADATIARQREDIIQLRKDRAEQSTLVAKRELTIKHRDQTIKGLEGTLGERDQTITELNSEVETLRNLVASLRAQIASAAEDFEAQSRDARLEAREELLRSEASHKDTQLRFEEAKRDFGVQLRSNDQELRQLREAVAKANEERYLNPDHHRANELEREVAHLKGELELEMKAKREERTATRDREREARIEYIKMEKQLKDVTKMNKFLTEHKDESAAKINQLAAEIATHEHNSVNNAHELARVRARLHELETTAPIHDGANMSKMIDSIRAAVSEERTTFNRYKNVGDLLKIAKIQDLEARLEEAELKYESYKEESNVLEFCLKSATDAIVGKHRSPNRTPPGSSNNNHNEGSRNVVRRRSRGALPEVHELALVRTAEKIVDTKKLQIDMLRQELMGNLGELQQRARQTGVENEELLKNRHDKLKEKIHDCKGKLDALLM